MRASAGNCHGEGEGASKSHRSLGYSPVNHFCWANEDRSTLIRNRRWDSQTNGLKQLFSQLELVWWPGQEDVGIEQSARFSCSLGTWRGDEGEIITYYDNIRRYDGLDFIHTLHNGPMLCELSGVLSLSSTWSSAAFSNKEGYCPTSSQLSLVLLFWKTWLKQTTQLTTG